MRTHHSASESKEISIRSLITKRSFFDRWESLNILCVLEEMSGIGSVSRSYRPLVTLTRIFSVRFLISSVCNESAQGKMARSAVSSWKEILRDRLECCHLVILPIGSCGMRTRRRKNGKKRGYIRQCVLT